MFYSRTSFSTMDFLGDIGGVLGILFPIVGLMVQSFSEHKFILKALKKLYLVKTRDTYMFETPEVKDQRKNEKKVKVTK
jgi:hypothetical protein